VWVRSFTDSDLPDTDNIVHFENTTPISQNKVDVLHVRLTELHAAHQNLPPAIRTLRVKETIKIYTKNERNLSIEFIHMRCIVSDMNSSIEVIYLLHFSVFNGFLMCYGTNLSSKKVTKWHLL